MTVKNALSAQQLAYVHIRDRILDGTFEGGRWLRSQDIASELALSRMPVREAFRQLEVEGLLTMRLNRGAIVTELSWEDVRDLFEIRANIEALAASYASGAMSARVLVDLEALRVRMDASRADVQAWMTRHEEFHQFIDNLGGRKRLAEEVARLRQAVQPYIRLYNNVFNTPMLRNVEHDAIVRALKSQNARQIELCVRDHVLSAADDIVEFLRQRPQAGHAAMRQNA